MFAAVHSVREGRKSPVVVSRISGRRLEMAAFSTSRLALKKCIEPRIAYYFEILLWKVAESLTRREWYSCRTDWYIIILGAKPLGQQCATSSHFKRASFKVYFSS